MYIGVRIKERESHASSCMVDVGDAYVMAAKCTAGAALSVEVVAPRWAVILTQGKPLLGASTVTVRRNRLMLVSATSY